MPDYRCTQCGTINSYSWAAHEKRAGLHKRKTSRVPCGACGKETVQNQRGK